MVGHGCHGLLIQICTGPGSNFCVAAIDESIQAIANSPWWTAILQELLKIRAILHAHRQRGDAADHRVQPLEALEFRSPWIRALATRS
jgi:hypothetical protein